LPAFLLAGYSDTMLDTAVKALDGDGDNAEGHALNLVDHTAVCKSVHTAGSLSQVEAIVHTAGVAPSIGSAKKITYIDLLRRANIIEAFLEVASVGTSLVYITSMAGSIIKLSQDHRTHFAAPS
jgi:hypothetical protein